jgi:hypothetical protein
LSLFNHDVVLGAERGERTRGGKGNTGGIWNPERDSKKQQEKMKAKKKKEDKNLPSVYYRNTSPRLSFFSSWINRAM